MRNTLRAQDEARAHLDRLCAERKCRRHAACITDTARADDRNVECIHHLRQECHGRDLADMTAGLRALSDHGIDTRTL